MSFSFRSLFQKESSETLSHALYHVQHQLNGLAEQVEQAKMLAAKSIALELRKQKDTVPLAQTEFKVFSQFGDDGIIQYIIAKLALPVPEQRFVEFGVENYRESNTRFLLLNNNWSGLVMDGSEAHVSFIRQDPIYWKHDLTALARFITRENINSILREAGFHGRMGILSIDVDGNDYWIWEAITVVDPAVVIVEYNGLFGSREAVTIPYQPDFTRKNAHYSLLYWGTSLKALCQLAGQKDYVWIGCNSAGNNAYFVRKAEASSFHLPSLPEDFVAAKFREGRDLEGHLAYIGQQDGFALIKDLPVWDVSTSRMRLVSDLVR
jgi:hypothetical protein